MKTLIFIIKHPIMSIKALWKLIVNLFKQIGG